MRKRFLVIGIVLLFICLSFNPSFAIDEEKNRIVSDNTFNDGSLSGFVNDLFGIPIEGALVRVYFHETYEEDYSDSNGYYYVDNIPICYCIKNATCSKEGYKTEWVLLSIFENTTYDFILYYTNENNPPTAPIIHGPHGKPRAKNSLIIKPFQKPLLKPGTYNYTFNATDPENDNISYFIDWGDGTTSGWIGPFASGVEIKCNHTWIKKGIYTLRAKAKDIYDQEGPWGSENIPIKYRGKFAINIMQFIEILKQLLKSI